MAAKARKKMSKGGKIAFFIFMGICVLAYTVVQSNMAFKLVIHEMIPMGPFIAVAMVTVMNFC